MGSAGGVLLPEDVILEILIYLPVKSLLQFKSVCRSWYALIKSSNFIYRHANTIDEHSEPKLGTFIFQTNEADQFFVLSGDESLEVFEDLGKLRPFFNKDYSNNPRGKAKMVASCHGIICIHYPEAKDIGLWNPATKQCRIVPKPLCNGNLHEDAVGFGFDVVNKDYKVLLIASFKREGWSMYYPFHCSCTRKVQIYSLSSDSWRCIDEDFAIHCNNVKKKGVYLNGNYFMIGVDTDARPMREVILSFDFSKEIFRTFLGPSAGAEVKGYYEYPLCHIYSIRDKLACTYHLNEHLYDICVLNDYNTKEECWSKLYSLRLSPAEDCSFGPLAFTRNGQFGILLTNKGIKLYNCAVGKTLHRSFGHVWNVDFYKESLVSLLPSSDEINLVCLESSSQ